MTASTKLETGTALGSSGAVAGFDEVATLPELLSWRVAATSGLEAYRQFDAGAGRWVGYSWREIDRQFDTWRRALDAERFAHGDRVAILVPNCIEHVAMDQAALSRGLVPVPMHAIDNPESIVFILQDSEASLLFVDSAERWQQLLAAGDRLDGLKRIVLLKGGEAAAQSDGRVVSLKRWLETGRVPGPAASPARVQAAPG